MMKNVVFLEVQTPGYEGIDTSSMVVTGLLP
jgi:hypothetical protein